MKSFWVFTYSVLLLLFPFVCRGQHITYDEPARLPGTINSTAEENLPLLSADGQSLFFNRTFHNGNVGGAFAGQDIWMSTLNPDSSWTMATNDFPSHSVEFLNDEYNNACVGISKNSDTVYLLNKYHHHNKKYKHHHHHKKTKTGIAYAVFRDGKWTTPDELKIPGLDPDKEFVSAYVTPAGNIAIVAMNSSEVEEVVNEDFYVTLRDEKGNWSHLIPLGESVNSSKDEISPFIYDDRILYFSSEREEGYGGFDIYYSIREDSTWTKWSEPVNVGPQINSPGFDAYYFRNEHIALFSRNLDTLTSDLFYSKITPVDPKKYNMDTLVYLKPFVHLDTLVPMKSLVSETQIKSTKNLDSLLYVEALGFKDEYHEEKGYKVVDLNEEEVRHLKKKELEDLQIVPKTINIKFEINLHNLDEEDKELLDKAIYLLKKDKGLYANVVGHACALGSGLYNMELSYQRAEEAYNYLIKHGIPKKRLITKWQGELKPIADNKTEEGRRQNRRVEIDFNRF